VQARISAGASRSGVDALERAREEGFAAGLAACQLEPGIAPNAERAELQAQVASITELMQDFDQRLTMFVVALSLQLSKLVLRGTARIKPDRVAPAVREAVSGLPGLRTQTRLHLHPADAALVREMTATDCDPGLPWEIVEDATLGRGQCRLADPLFGADGVGASPWRPSIDALARSVDWIDFDESGEPSGPP
jgi:flagellar assembly protein FliH